MQSKANWQAYTGENRHNIIDQVQDRVDKCSGNVLDHTMFSDLQVNLLIEIPENKMIDLYHSLEEIFQLSKTDFGDLDTDAEREWIVFLNISFSKGSGDLKIDIPRVPG